MNERANKSLRQTVCVVKIFIYFQYIQIKVSSLCVCERERERKREREREREREENVLQYPFLVVLSSLQGFSFRESQQAPDHERSNPYTILWCTSI
jgi:hypothetical protein